MPFFKCNSGLVYFFHVPKCGGSSIEKALIEKNIRLSFYDPKFLVNGNKNYCRTSPQHITAKDFETLFVDDTFDYKFSIVRDPVSRLLSAYAFNRREIGWFVSFERFLSVLEKNVSRKDDFFGAKFDNHFVPANRLVPENCDVFHLETDLHKLERMFIEEFGITINFSIIENKGLYDLGEKTSVKNFIKKMLVSESPRKADTTDQVISRIKILYEEDYRRFKYR